MFTNFFLTIFLRNSPRINPVRLYRAIGDVGCLLGQFIEFMAYSMAYNFGDLREATQFVKVRELCS